MSCYAAVQIAPFNVPRGLAKSASASTRRSLDAERYNARIQPTGKHCIKPSILRMKGMLIPVGCNELLGSACDVIIQLEQQPCSLLLNIQLL
jgi:hypothetical protein